MIRFDIRDPLSWTGFAFGVALSLTVVALSLPEPATGHHDLPCNAATRWVPPRGAAADRWLSSDGPGWP